MLFYFVIILFLVLLSIGKIKRVSDKTVLVIIMMFLYFLATFRSIDIGNDTRVYHNLFKHICSFHNLSFWSNRYEIGYLWLNEIISHLTNNFWVFLFIIDAIIYYAYYLLFQKYSINPLFSVFLFFVLGSWGQTLNIIRLQLAIAMMIYAYLSKENNKKLFMVVFIIMALFFQRISAIFILSYFIPKKINIKFYSVCMLLTFFCYLFFYKIISFIAPFIPTLNHYLNSSTYVMGDTKIATLITIFMRLIIIAFCLYIFIKKKNNMDFENCERIGYQINLVIISLLIMIISLRFNLLDRCSYYYWNFVYLLIPNIVHYLNYENKNIIKISIILFGIIYFISVNVYRPNWNHIYPYKTILFENVLKS